MKNLMLAMKYASVLGEVMSQVALLAAGQAASGVVKFMLKTGGMSKRVTLNISVE